MAIRFLYITAIAFLCITTVIAGQCMGSLNMLFADFMHIVIIGFCTSWHPSHTQPVSQFNLSIDVQFDIRCGSGVGQLYQL